MNDMKNFLWFLICFCGLWLLPAEGLALSAYITGVKEFANIRTEPKQEAEIIGTVPLGGEVEVLSEDTNAQWLLICYEGKSGYIRDRYLRVDAAPISDAGSDTGRKGDQHGVLWLGVLWFVLFLLQDKLNADWLRKALVWGLPLFGLLQLCSVPDPFWFISPREVGFLLAVVGYVGMLFFYFLMTSLLFASVSKLKEAFDDGLSDGLLNCVLVLCYAGVMYLTFRELSWYNIIVLLLIAYNAWNANSSDPKKEDQEATPQPDYDCNDCSGPGYGRGSDCSSRFDDLDDEDLEELDDADDELDADMRHNMERLQKETEYYDQKEAEKRERMIDMYNELVREADALYSDYEDFCQKARDEKDRARFLQSEAQRYLNSDDEANQNRAREMQDDAERCMQTYDEYVDKANNVRYKYDSVCHEAEIIKNDLRL